MFSEAKSYIKKPPEFWSSVLFVDESKYNVLEAKSYIKKPPEFWSSVLFVDESKYNVLEAKSYIKKPPKFWSSVLFVDESKYNVFGSDGKQMVWRKPNSELEIKNPTPSVKHGDGSQMVWGCMSAVGVGNLLFIDGMMDKYMYLDILKQKLKQSAEKMDILPHYKLYQNNDPKHNIHIRRLWTLSHFPQVIRIPAQSPDLNPIENIWDHLNNRIRKFKSKNLVKSMPKRLNEVIRCKGGPTRY
ncbi:Transposable element Tcb1 transposase [Araneus ventricosus]|uniref:Transposable element Tcb1 transposase n=1 Tax=Araneus ventricosus TaxID=182803 RepID=A0A4Y2S0H3_ARAVE|nr:Transposable element Tcb1 transposase [Araneus ventricosus]